MNALFVAWRGGDGDHGTWGPVGRLEYVDGLYRFCYTRGAKTLSGFRPFPQMSDLEQVYESQELFPLFANRLLSPSRAEYDAYLRWGGFETGQRPDPIAILGVTEGIRQTDSIEVFPCPAPDASGCYANSFFLHGLRWLPPQAIERINRLTLGEPLFLMWDACNQVDANAVALRTQNERMLIGYVPRYLSRDVVNLLVQSDPGSITLTVQRLNPDAPLQHRLLCRMHALWPEGFEPCRGQEFQPIPQVNPAACAAV